MSSLAMWTVYDRPTDYPDKFVARRFDVDRDGAKATDSIIIAETIDELRHALCFHMGLTVLQRDPSDDPNIVETWL